MIKAVIFDVDEVLLDSFEANFLFFKELFEKTGFAPPTKEEFKSQFHLPMWDVIKTVTKLKDDKKIEEIWNFGKNGDFRPNEPKLSEGADSLVKELSRDYSLAVVTSRVKLYIFEGPMSELKHYFSVAVGYEDTKNHKPHPEPLLLAVKQLNVRPEEAVYIGDAESDVVAAKAAGTKIIGYSKEPLEGADGNTSILRNILELIKAL